MPRLEDIALAAPRVTPPRLASRQICSSAPYNRAAHTYGKAFIDYVRGMQGDYACAPDVVAFPRSEAEVAAVLDWAGGVQACDHPLRWRLKRRRRGRAPAYRNGTRCKAAVTLDLREMGRVREVDCTSRAARIEGGAFGPALEAELRPHGVTLPALPAEL